MKRLMLLVVPVAALTAACSAEPQKIRCDSGTPELKFFNGKTGKAIVFYHKIGAGDEIVCFDNPGYDPWTQDKLYPVTQAIRGEILRQPDPCKPKPPAAARPAPTPAPTPCTVQASAASDTEQGPPLGALPSEPID